MIYKNNLKRLKGNFRIINGWYFEDKTPVEIMEFEDMMELCVIEINEIRKKIKEAKRNKITQ